MVKEYNVPQFLSEQEAKEKARFDSLKKIASEIFTEPKYQISSRGLRYDLTICLNFRPIVSITDYSFGATVNVENKEVYADARKMAEELEKRLGIDVTLRTTYPLPNPTSQGEKSSETSKNEKSSEPQETKKPSLLKRIFG